MHSRDPAANTHSNVAGRSAGSAPARMHRFSAWGFALLCAWAGALPGRGHAAEPDARPFSVGFSTSMFADVNENDARAAVKVWARTMVRDRSIPADPDPQVLSGTEAMVRALRDKRVDSLAMTIAEYEVLRNEVSFRPFIASIKSGVATEEYVILVRKDSEIEGVADLRGRSVAFLRHPRADLAAVWFETLLLEGGLGRTDRFCGQVTHLNKLPKVVLPVFFGQTDACVVPYEAFRTMSELNPQLGQQLKVLVTSPAMVPCGFFMREAYSPPYRGKLLDFIGKVEETPAGLQVLTIFQCDRLRELPLSCLDSALELLATHRRLTAGADAVDASRRNGIPSLPGGAGL